MSRVRKLAETILSSPRYVKVNQERVETVAKLLQDVQMEVPRWDFPPLYPQTDDFEEMCHFYLVFNAINYCYFDQDRKRFEDGELRGSSLVCTRLTEAWKEIRDPTFLANVDETHLLGELFRAEGPISLVKERTEALREVGRFLNENQDFTFRKLFQKYKENAYYISQVIPNYLPTWRDPFCKRAQLFVGMVYGKFQDLEDLPIAKYSLADLTVFADYRVPETLIRMGIIEPSATLKSWLHRREFIASGSRKELEIRAATIVGADVLTEALNKYNQTEEPVNILHTDFLLWSTGRKIDEAPEGVFVDNHVTHHYTLTTDY